MTTPTFRAIIPAGGAGTRLWPLSRRHHPKFLQDVTGSGRTLLQATVDRLAPITDEVVVVTGQAHATSVAAQLPEVATVFTEPSPRDSMPAIGLAAAVLRRRHPEEDLVVGSFAADHTIIDGAAFEAAVIAAVAAARQDYVVTIGIAPDNPSTAFGYIRQGEPLPATGVRPNDGVVTAPALGVWQVREFVEKPAVETAQSYLAEGGYLWNAGMYVARANVLLGHLDTFHPELAAGLETIAAAWDTPDRDRVLDEIWPTLTKIAIDHAISEPLAPTGAVAVVPADLGWNDVGDWQAIAALAGVGVRSDAAVLGDFGDVLRVGSPGGIVATSGKQIVVLGIEDAVVIDTPDALLVTTLAHAQQVKDIPALLAEAGRKDLL